ncbi:MAG: hypothetical protein JXB34_13710 [Bacteroidales bacterium]|nr:hypothetical protein [Bacteroidales bacterium]
MKKHLRLLTAIVLLIMFMNISCEKDDNNSPLAQLEQIKGTGYFPMQVGNKWKLSNLPEKVIDKIVNINGTDYFRMIDGDTNYYRQTNDGKIYVKGTNTEEILKFDLSAETGHTWDYTIEGSADTWQVSLLSKNDTIKLDNHTFYNCYRFYYNIPQFADEEYIIWLAPDLGFVEIIYMGGTGNRNKLEAATINGINIEF